MGGRRVNEYCEVCGNKVDKKKRSTLDDGLRKAKIEELQERRAAVEDELTSILEELVGLGVEI